RALHVHRRGHQVSIFSRLFNKNAEGDAKEPSDDESSSNEKPEKRARNSKSPGGEGRSGTMRPVAPALQINPPVAERDAKAGPVVQVDSKGKNAAGDKSAARGAQANSAQGDAAKRAVGKQTQKMGSNAQAPAYAAPPAGAVARRSSRPPKPDASVQASAGVAGGGGRSTGVGDKAMPAKMQAPPPMPADPGKSLMRDEALNGPLTLDLGSSSLGEVRPKTSSHDQGLRMNPQQQSAAQARALPALEPEVDQSWSVPPARNDLDANKVLVDSSWSVPPVAAVPPAPPVPAAAVPETSKLLNDLDEAFGAIVESANNGNGRSIRPSAAPPPNASIAELRELFGSLAANHMQQVRDFMIGVRWGEAPRDWIPICEPAVASLLRAAKEMDLLDLVRGLEGYRDALTRAADTTGATIAGTARDGLIAAYGKLADVMPEAFGLDGERGRREAIIVHALLQQVPEVRKITIDKIYAAGLASLDNLFLAKPDEIAATTGMSESLAERIVEKVQRYRQEIATLADATRSAEKNHLAKLAVELRELHQQFESVESAWSDDGHAKKKHLRQARSVALLQVKVLLARLGEVDRLAQLERLPFERKIEQLEGYLQEANGEKRAAP
ncbi:MAG: helix-hairpin-helix domain-containing protein, partial [Polyangiaceae bacterium]